MKTINKHLKTFGQGPGIIIKIPFGHRAAHHESEIKRSKLELQHEITYNKRKYELV